MNADMINTEGAKKCIHILRKEKNCIKTLILNVYGKQKMNTSHV